MRGTICMILVCACFFMGACSGAVIIKSEEGPAAPPQAEREAVSAQPTPYPFALLTPTPQASADPVPQSAPTRLVEQETQAPASNETAKAVQDATEGAKTYTGQVEEPAETESYPSEETLFHADVNAFDAQGYALAEGYALIEESAYSESAYPASQYSAAIPALFEVNDAVLAGIPFDALPEHDRAAVKRAVSAQGYDTKSISVTHKTDTLVSCLVNTGRATLPINVDCQTGDIVKLADFFSYEDTGWRGLIPDIVMAAADLHGLTLLCDVPPVDDAHPCFVLDGNIVLLYRPYEITTYEAGSPCFTLPMRDIYDYTTGAYGIGG